MTELESSAEADGADVEPDRSLFISMLTRDIDLIPAILDLWDNSVDGALRFLPKDDAKRSKSLKKFKIEIEVSDTGFLIKDNCGGIRVQDARERAFRLGRPDGDDAGIAAEGAVGIFGVGMKRALFKLGKLFRVESNSIAGAFALEVNVPVWAVQEGKWTFPFESVDDAAVYKAPQQTSTKIWVSDLYQNVAAQFSDKGFLERLSYELRTRRSEQDWGIVTHLNGTSVNPIVPVLAQGADFGPAVKQALLQEGVRIAVRAGVVKPKTVQDPASDGDATNFVGRDDGGWYVRANGRVLLAADKSRLTGWGDDTARYHPQFRNFRGYVDITAVNGALLPWNTTKTGVDENSEVWQKAYGMMRPALAEVQTVINRLKEERTAELDGQGRGPVSAALESARLVPVEAISTQKDVAVKYPNEPITAVRNPMSRINFAVERERFDIAAEALGVAKGPELGHALFEYFWKIEIDS